MITPKLSQQQLFQIVAKMRTKIGKPTSDNLVCIAALVLEKVKFFRKLNTCEKKDLTIYIMEQLILDYIKSDDNIDIIMKTIIPGAIDTLQDVSKGTINLGKTPSMFVPKSIKTAWKKRIGGKTVTIEAA
ncbi:MAG: hypothetical protein CL728_04725 [Chloroflexi bacterium]|nr:hypothetical protein [Chloroflexota bacterium]|tara:strand:+ start:1614 stop:2003 length:390 start_codon:yes stop_codon:yes gene_type:complete